MKRRTLKNSITACLAVLLTIGATANAVTYVLWNDNAHDGNWNNGTNWSTGSVPPNNSSYYARCQMTTGPIITTLQNIGVYRIYLDGAGNGTMTVNDGAVTVTSHMYCAAASTDVGTLNMNGGTLTIGGTFYIARDSGSIGTVNLLGGTVDCVTLNMGLNPGAIPKMNIEGNGKLIFTTSNAPVTTYIQSGWITAYNGAGSVVVDTTTIPGRTILTALISYKATVPRPADTATGMIYNTTTLSWNPGVNAVSHDVYLGTVSADVNNAQRFAGDINGNGVVDFKDLSKLTQYWLLDPTGTEPYVGLNPDTNVNFIDYALLAQNWKSSSTIFKGNQDANSFNPGNLAFGTTYYWRIDEVKGPDTTKGNVWSFTIYSGKAIPLAPQNGASDVLARGVVSWTAAPGAVSHDVYFGTTNPPPFVTNQTGTVYNPGGMTNSTTYYWRIDEHYSGSTPTVTGDVRTFTTIDAASEPEVVFVQVTDVQIGMCANDSDRWQLAVSKINNINPDFIVDTGDHVQNWSTSNPFTASMNLYLSIAAGLNPGLSIYHVPGNHDIGDTPTPDRYPSFLSVFPNPFPASSSSTVPWYSFSYGNTLLIGLDDLVLRSPTNYPDANAAEMSWLTTTLQNSGAYSHKIVYMHVAPCVSTVDEAYNSTYNLPIPIRQQLLSLFHTYGVTLVLAGHVHVPEYVNDNGLEMIVTESTTCPLGSLPQSSSGITLVKVYSDHITHTYYALDDLP